MWKCELRCFHLFSQKCIISFLWEKNEPKKGERKKMDTKGKFLVTGTSNNGSTALLIFFEYFPCPFSSFFVSRQEQQWQHRCINCFTLFLPFFKHNHFLSEALTIFFTEEEKRAPLGLTNIITIKWRLMLAHVSMMYAICSTHHSEKAIRSNVASF